jgi:hypothetical protein
MPAQPDSQTGAPGLTVVIAGTPDRASDRAVEQFFTSLLEREQPGTTWVVPARPSAANSQAAA